MELTKRSLQRALEKAMEALWVITHPPLNNLKVRFEREGKEAHGHDEDGHRCDVDNRQPDLRPR